MNAFYKLLKDNVVAIAPIIALVLVLGIFVVPIGIALIAKFLIGAVFIILGLAFFLLGVDIAILPLGSHTSEVISKSGKIWVLMGAGIILGFFISLAEPDMNVLASNVAEITKGSLSSTSLIVFVSVGFAITLTLGFRRIFSKIPLHFVLFALYCVIGIAAIFTPSEFLALAFDSSGATTGILAVPFIIALGVGISSRKKDSLSAEEDCFGLVAMASAGAVAGVLALSIVSRGAEYDTSFPEIDITESILHSFQEIFFETIVHGFITLLPLFIIFIILHMVALKLKKRPFQRIITGFIYAFIGFIIFFLGVKGGFMDVASLLGSKLAALGNNVLTISIGFIIGLITIIAEPAVYVQTHQIENVTHGHIKRRLVLIPFCLGVGIAVMLSVIRIIYPGIMLWYFLLPGFAIALGLAFFVPKIFVGIGFDAGGVATGPMTATFILSFTQGVAANKPDANMLLDGFGMISLVCMFPIVTIQVLGLLYKVKTRNKQKSAAEEA